MIGRVYGRIFFRRNVGVGKGGKDDTTGLGVGRPISGTCKCWCLPALIVMMVLRVGLGSRQAWSILLADGAACLEVLVPMYMGLFGFAALSKGPSTCCWRALVEAVMRAWRWGLSCARRDDRKNGWN